MENSTYPQVPSWNDLVFENRNKTFGAYQLREQYDRNVKIALLICAAITGISLSVPSLLSMFGINSKVLLKVPNGPTITLVDQPIIIPITPPVKPKEPFVKTKNPDAVPTVTTERVIEKPDLSRIESTSVDPTASSVGGDPVGIAAPVEPPVIVEPKKLYTSVEVMPAYDGGLEGLYKFLGKNLRYPAIDRRNGTEGVVYVQFVIDEFGSTTNIEVIKGISTTLDQEAKRVISLLKPWKPGYQNHQAVSVKMVLPIKFKLTS